MALKITYNQSGHYYNAPYKIFSASCDLDLTSANVNTILPNNKSNYMSDTKDIPTGSQIVVMCKTYALGCIFDAGASTDGIWRIISKIPFVTV